MSPKLSDELLNPGSQPLSDAELSALRALQDFARDESMRTPTELATQLHDACPFDQTAPPPKDSGLCTAESYIWTLWCMIASAAESFAHDSMRQDDLYAVVNELTRKPSTKLEIWGVSRPS